MDRLSMCRICSAENVRLCIVASRNLHKLYETLTNIPFVTQDRRPLLACGFCFAKLKQCYRLLRQCLKAEELFAQNMSDNYELNPLINQAQLEFCSGLITSPIFHINIDDECQTGNTAIKEELPAVSDGLDVGIQPMEEYQIDEAEHENLDNRCLDVADIPPHCYKSDLEDDVPLIICKFEVEDEEVSKTKRRVTETIELEPENLDNSCLGVADIPPHYYESDLEVDKPLTMCKTEAEDEKVLKKKIKARETIKDNVVRKPKQDTRRTKKKDAITAEQTTQDKSDSKVIQTTQKWTSKPDTYFKEPYICIRSSSNDVKKHTGEKPYKCEMCHRHFSKKIDLTRHIRTHTGEKPYKCEICQRNFSKKNDLTRHIRAHTGEKPYKCEICQRNFSKKNDLTRHIRAHTGEKPYQCDICQRNFSRKGDLTTHMRIHTGEKPFKCEICQRNFSQKSHLTTHVRTHTDEKPYKCEICQRNFSQKGQLTTHVRTHTDETPYQCDICQRNFSRKIDLTTHMRIHTGEKPFKCEICQRNFSQKSHLTTHVRTHTDEKPYKCDICQRNFRRKGDLTSHVRTHW